MHVSFLGQKPKGSAETELSDNVEVEPTLSHRFGQHFLFSAARAIPHHLLQMVQRVYGDSLHSGLCENPHEFLQAEVNLAFEGPHPLHGVLCFTLKLATRIRSQSLKPICRSHRMTNSLLRCNVILVAQHRKGAHRPEVGGIEIRLISLHVVDGRDERWVICDDSIRAVSHEGPLNHANVNDTAFYKSKATYAPYFSWRRAWLACSSP